jgi:hypothetical protein
MQRRGISLEEALRMAGVPFPLRQFFSPDGSFQIPGPRISLLPENGDHEYSNIRMNWSSHPDQFAISRELLLNLIEAVRAVRSLHLTVVLNANSKASVNEVLEGLPQFVSDRVKVVILADAIPIELWARDGSKPLQFSPSEKPAVVMPRTSAHDWHQQRYMWSVAAISAASQTEIISSPLAFRGGDIVVGARQIFVGKKTIERNAHELSISFNDSFAAFQQHFDGDVVLMEAADFDLDLSLALVRDKKSGEEVALLASPWETLKFFLEDLKEREKGGFTFDLKGLLSDGVHGSLFERLSQLNLTPGEKDFLHFLDQLAGSKELQIDFEARAAALEAQRRQLQQLRYRIIEVPDFGLVREASTSPHRGPTDTMTEDEQAFARSRVNTPGAFNYVNSVFSRNFALVPVTGVRILDRHYQNIIRGLGYPTFGIPAVQRSMCLKGGARCLLEAY